MSLELGKKALNLALTKKIPRTEYSADFHWELIKAETGISITDKSTEKEKQKATNAFIEKWDYSFFWSVGIASEIFGDVVTKMGHASYESGGSDFNNKITSPFSEPEELFDFNPMDTFGKIDVVKKIQELNIHYDRNVENYPQCVNMTGIYVTLMSGILEIFGWDNLLMAAAIDKKEFGELFNRYTEWISQYFVALADSKSEVIMVHDDIAWTSGAFIEPQWYEKYIFPNYKKLVKILKDKNKKIIFTSDGNIDEFIDNLIDCGFDGFVLEPVTNMKKVIEKCGKTHVIIGGINTNTLLLGTKKEIEQAVKSALDMGRDCPGFFLAVGNHIPPNTPVENALFYNKCYERYNAR